MILYTILRKAKRIRNVKKITIFVLNYITGGNKGMEIQELSQAWNLVQQSRIRSSQRSGRAKCERGWNWHPLPLSDYDLWYVISGRGQLVLNGEAHPLTAGSCFHFKPGDRISAEQDPDDRLTVIFMHHTIEATETGPLPHVIQIQDTYWFEQLLNRLLSLDTSPEQPFIEEEFELLMKTALCHILREQHIVEHEQLKLNPMVQQMVSYIKENPSAPLDTAAVATQVELSPRYASLLFKQGTGVSMKTFIARARIERASHLLTESTMNISQIADTLGYSDIYFFSRQFKRFLGESPTLYRKRTRRADSHF